MGNQHSGAHGAARPRKSVHWRSAGRPAAPGKPEIIPILGDDEPNSITLRWAATTNTGGAPLQGYQVECNRLGSAAWIPTSLPVVQRPELVLSGLDPPHRYQFRVAALNAVGRSDYSELSDVLTVSSERGMLDPPLFLQHLEDVTALENDTTEFRVTFAGSPPPTVAWYKDAFEIFSSRRTAITTDDTSSVLVFHQTLPSDEGEIKCTATNRTGHAVTKGRLSLEAAPKLRYPRQYEDGLLYEINETVFLKTSIVGKPAPAIEWRHDGQPLLIDERIEITTTSKFSMLKIHSARRSDRGEYHIHASNRIGEDTAAFLVTITAPPDPPRRVSVTRQVDKSVTLDWEPPEDDGGCRIGNYVVEYYRIGWNVWLKATTSRKTVVTLFDLIEGSEYRFRVKAESPYGMSAPSAESPPVLIPGKPVDMEFLAVESKIINDVMLKEDGAQPQISPAPRRKRLLQASKEEPPIAYKSLRTSPGKEKSTVKENAITPSLRIKNSSDDKEEKRKSFQLDLEDALSPPPISLSAPELSLRYVLPFKALRNSVSSTELLHERAMARFYKVVAMKEEQVANKERENRQQVKEASQITHIPLNNTNINEEETKLTKKEDQNYTNPEITDHKPPAIFIKTDSIEGKEFKYVSRQPSYESEKSEGKWHSMSFEEDYTASTVSSEDEGTEEGSLNEDIDRHDQLSNEEYTYSPRGKPMRPSPIKEDESADENIKLLPLPDPNYVPKPILKKREPEIIEMKQETPKKKDEKSTLFKKFTKMPVQKPFSFTKMLSKKDQQKVVEPEEQTPPKILNKITEKTDDKDNDEGRTVIEYYGNIVKEYGSQKRYVTPLYLNTEDLKIVAEKQQEQSKKIKSKSTENVNPKQNKVKQRKPLESNSTKQVQNKSNLNKIKANTSKINKTSNSKVPADKLQEKHTRQIVLKKAERATIVIPIDYEELEEQAKVNVRSAIDYAVDMCLLLLAFWVYFFKDERLAIPFLILIIYRQLQETILQNIPQWMRRHTPTWLKTKYS